MYALRLKKFVKQVLQFHEGNLILATQNLIKKMKQTSRKYKSCSIYEIKYAMAQNNEIYKTN